MARGQRGTPVGAFFLVWRKTAFAVVLALAFGSGCSTNPHLQGVPPEEAQVQAELALDEIGRHAETIELTGAYWDGEQLFVSYAAAGQTRYGRSDYSAQQNLSIHADWLPVYYVQASDAETFANKARTGSALKILDTSHWSSIRLRVAEALVPAEPERGVLINERDQENFVYRGQDGQLRLSSLFEKPPAVPLVANYRIEAMSDLSDYFEAHLDEQGIADRHVLFSTGETGPYARPFAYLDRDGKVISLGSLEPFTFGSMPNNYAVRGGKVGWQFARSYYIEPFNRPVSYFARLFFLVTDFARDLTRGAYTRAFRFDNLDARNIPPLSDSPGMDLDEWETWLSERFNGIESRGEIEFLIDGDGFFPMLVDAIASARESVKVRTYIFDRDDYAIAFADLLKKRADDIDVQVMVDGLGTLMAQNKAAGTMPADYEAPIGITTYLKEGSKVRVRSLTNPWLAGDHTKTTVIDGNLAFAGGMNIGREYRWEWHDLMVALRGPIVSAIEWEFDKAWAHAAVAGDLVLTGHKMVNEPRPIEPSGYPIHILRTQPGNSQIYRAQLRAVRDARSYVYIQNAYFSDTTMIYELARARLRGVDVRIIIPMEGNHGILNKSNVVAANTLLRYGVRVFTYPGMSHIKAGIYDGWMCLGSANFDKLSFRINKELNIATSDSGAVQRLLDTVFLPDFANSLELTKPLPAGWGNSFASIVASQLL